MLHCHGVAGGQIDVVAIQRLTEVVFHGHVAGERHGAAIGEADGTHVLGIDRHTVSVDSVVFVPVVLHGGTFAQVQRAAVAGHLNDGSEGLIGVGHIIDSCFIIGISPILQVAAAVEVGIGSVPLDMGDVGTGTAVEGDVLSGEAVAAAHHNHRAAVDALLVGQFVVVAVIAYHLDGWAVGTGDVHRRFDVHRVDNGDHVALLIDTLFQCFAEALYIEVRVFANVCSIISIIRYVAEGVYGDPLVGCNPTCHRVGRGQIDGVAVCTGLHIDSHMEGATRHVLHVADAFEGQHGFANIAIAGNLVVDASTVEGKLHVDNCRSTTIEGTHKVALLVVAITIASSDSVHFEGTAVP